MIVIDLSVLVAVDAQGVRRRVKDLHPLVLSSRPLRATVGSIQHDLVFYPETLDELLSLAEDVYGLTVRLRTSLHTDIMIGGGSRLTFENRAASWLDHSQTYSTFCGWSPTSVDGTKMFRFAFQDGGKWLRQTAIRRQGPYHVAVDESWLSSLNDLWAPDADR